MNNLRKISPFALGIALCCYQVVQQPMARAASLGSNNGNGSDLTSLSPSVPVDAPATAGVAAGGCPLNSLKAPSKSGALPSQGTAASSSLGYQSENIAESGTASSSKGAGSVKVAQLVPDANCCELGGTADCELGGIAPAGGAASAGGFPFAALAGLLPAALIPLAFTGGGNNNNNPAPVPEPSSTAGIVAGFGMLGLWFSRRVRANQKPSA
jgi:PEP-CTERM motif